MAGDTKIPLDLYKKGKCLGIGGVGSVREYSLVHPSEHPDLPSSLAVKKIRKSNAEKYISSHHKIKSLTDAEPHPNLVRIYDIQMDKAKDESGADTCRIIMERLQGDLKNLWKNRRLTLLECSILLGQILAGLDYLHENGIMHRDLKPSNILIQSNDDTKDWTKIDIQDITVKIADYDFVRQYQPYIPGEKTQEMTTLGTQKYMSPELKEAWLKGDPTAAYTEKSDTFAIGVIFYEMLLHSVLKASAQTLKDSGEMEARIKSDDDIDAAGLTQLLMSMCCHEKHNRKSPKQLLKHQFLQMGIEQRTLRQNHKRFADSTNQWSEKKVKSYKPNQGFSEMKDGEVRFIKTEGSLAKPAKVASFEARCPLSFGNNSSCSKDRKARWHCFRCKEQLEYGFDGYVYCHCGGTELKHCLFRCSDQSHGDEYALYPDVTAIASVCKTIKSFNSLTILLLGETGVGTSTFIKGCENYFKYQNWASAKNGVLSPIKTKNYSRIKVTTRSEDNESHKYRETFTQKTKAHVLPYKGANITLIDTPGFGDSRGVLQDAENFDNILTFISNYKEIHGICIFLRANDSRLTTVLRFCINELLTHLHQRAAQNIVFVFTNARQTSYMPGDTLPALRALYPAQGQTPIELSKDTIYLVDNEAYRYLAAIKQDVSFVGRSNDEPYKSSWEKSRSEIARMLEYFNSLESYPVANTSSINDLRVNIIKLTQPLVEIVTQIDITIEAVAEHKERIQALEASLESSIFGERKAIGEADKIIRELQAERQEILKACAHFGFFVKKYSLVPYNDTMDAYLEIKIKDIERDERQQTAEEMNRTEILCNLKEQYLDEVALVKKAARNASIDKESRATEKEAIKRSLSQMKHYGENTNNVLKRLQEKQKYMMLKELEFKDTIESGQRSKERVG